MLAAIQLLRQGASSEALLRRPMITLGGHQAAGAYLSASFTTRAGAQGQLAPLTVLGCCRIIPLLAVVVVRVYNLTDERVCIMGRTSLVPRPVGIAMVLLLLTAAFDEFGGCQATRTRLHSQHVLERHGALAACAALLRERLLNEVCALGSRCGNLGHNASRVGQSLLRFASPERRIERCLTELGLAERGARHRVPA